MEVQRVFIDANILFSRTLRDWMFMLRIETQGQMFTLSTSEDALVEAQYSFRKEHPSAPGHSIARIRNLVAEFCDEIVADYRVIPNALLADKYDLHIHAAAKSVGAHILVTQDKGFLSLSKGKKDGLPYEVMNADDFFVLLYDSAPQFVTRVVKDQMVFWATKRETDSRDNSMTLKTALLNSNCPNFAERVSNHLQNLAGVTGGR